MTNVYNTTMGVEIEGDLAKTWQIWKLWAPFGKCYKDWHTESVTIGEIAMQKVHLQNFDDVLEMCVLTKNALQDHIIGGYDLFAGSAHVHIGKANLHNFTDDWATSKWLIAFLAPFMPKQYIAKDKGIRVKTTIGIKSFRGSGYNLFATGNRSGRDTWRNNNDLGTYEYRLNEGAPLWVYFLLHMADHRPPEATLEKLGGLYDNYLAGSNMLEKYKKNFPQTLLDMSEFFNKVLALVRPWLRQELPTMVSNMPAVHRKVFQEVMQRYVGGTLSYAYMHDYLPDNIKKRLIATAFMFHPGQTISGYSHTWSRPYTPFMDAVMKRGYYYNFNPDLVAGWVKELCRYLSAEDQKALAKYYKVTEEDIKCAQ